MRRVVLEVSTGSGGAGQARAPVNGVIMYVYREYETGTLAATQSLYVEEPALSGTKNRTLISTTNVTSGGAPVAEQMVGSDLATVSAYQSPGIAGAMVVLSVTGATTNKRIRYTLDVLEG